MKHHFILTLFTLLFSLTGFSSDNLRGSIFKNADGEILLKTNEQEYLLQPDQRIQKYMDEVFINSPGYVFEVEGEINTETVKVWQTPRIVGDALIIKGTLSFNPTSGHFYLNETKTMFGRTKEINTYSFDNLSKHSFVGKEVITHGHFENIKGEEIYIINAILETKLISVDPNNLYPPPPKALANPLKFVLQEMPKNEYARSRTPFRLTLNGHNHVPLPGESVMIITLSGRQGDEPGAAGGHFAIGMGEVQEDLSIKGETFNFYFQGSKEVLAGNTDLVSYFGHLIQGQQNYRPTFTIYAYGVDKEMLLEARDIFENHTSRVRTEPGLSITPSYNCTTTSIDTLKEIGFFGNHDNFFAKLFDPQNLWNLNPFSWGSRSAKGEGAISKIRQLSYVLKTDREYFMPRNALESFIINFDSEKRREKMGIKRVDYVFIPQTLSNRPIGGISYNQISEANKTIKLQKLIAAKISEGKGSKEEIQKMVDDLLLSID